jgi:deoxyribodipyrimidine photo-lyase
MGGASRWWLHGSLRAFAADLHRLGALLVLRRGKCATVVAAFAAEVGAGAVYVRVTSNPSGTRPSRC